MKVIHFLNELKFSGAEIMYVDAASVFQKLGCELTVVNTAPNLGVYTPAFEKAGYKVKHLVYPKGWYQRWKYYRKVVKLLKSEQYDVVHIHRSDLKWGISLCAWLAGCKAIYTFHNVFQSHWYSYPLHLLQRWSVKHIFGCTLQTISDSVYENELNYYHTKTTKIYNWYGSNRFYPADEQEKKLARKKLGLTEDSLVMISIGGCSPIKRHNDAILAFSKVLKIYPDAIYLHLGEGASTQEEIQLAKQLNCYQQIRFLGNQKDVRNFLIASDIFVMPSKHEGLSITAIETMGTGIPEILYDVPGLRDFNAEAECVMLIPNSSDILADSIIRLYKDKDLQLTLSHTAKKYVDKNFSMEKNARKIYELYCK